MTTSELGETIVIHVDCPPTGRGKYATKTVIANVIAVARKTLNSLLESWCVGDVALGLAAAIMVSLPKHERSSHSPDSLLIF